MLMLAPLSRFESGDADACRIDVATCPRTPGREKGSSRQHISSKKERDSVTRKQTYDCY